MKGRNFNHGLLVIMLAFGMIFASCEKDDKTYTVITYSQYYSIYQRDVGTLNDGDYMRVELSNDGFNRIASGAEYGAIDKEKWTEEQIVNYLVGKGFSNNEANKATAWLLSVGHGFIVFRKGGMVYFIFK